MSVQISFINRLPDFALIHAIQFDNDRELYPLISKRFAELWLRAGHAAINAALRRNSVLFVGRITAYPSFKHQTDLASLRNGSKELDAFFDFVINAPIKGASLASGQTILPRADRANFSFLMKFRAVEKLEALLIRIRKAEDRNLIELTHWLKQHTPTAQAAFKDLDQTQCIAAQAGWVRSILKNSQICAAEAPVDAVENFFYRNDSPLSAVPAELLMMDVTSTILTYALGSSVSLGQLPFVEALKHSPQKTKIPAEKVGAVFRLSVLSNFHKHVILLLDHPNLSDPWISVGLQQIISQDHKPIVDRLLLLQIFLTHKRVSQRARGNILSSLISLEGYYRFSTQIKRCAGVDDNVTIPHPFTIEGHLLLIDGFLADQPIDSEIRFQALYTAVKAVMDCDQTIEPERLRVLEFILAYPSTHIPHNLFEKLRQELAVLIADSQTEDVRDFAKTYLDFERTRPLSLCSARYSRF
jgi:hypothetical protein